MQKKYISLLFVPFILLFCSNQSLKKEVELEFLDNVLSAMDGKTLEESQKLFVEGYDAFIPFLSFWGGGEEMEIEEFTDEEEEWNEQKPLSLSTESLTLNRLKNGLVATHTPDRSYSIEYVKHIMSEDTTSTYTPTTDRAVKSNLSIDLENYRTGTAASVYYQLKGIYYKDGSYEEASMDEEQRSFSLPNLKLIDSVRLVARHKYPTKFVTISISMNNKTAEYAGGKAVLKKLDKNVAHFVVDEAISDSYVETQARTKSGRIVGTSSWFSSHMSPSDSKKLISSVEKHLGKVAENIKDEKYKTKEELVEDIISAGKKIYIPESNNQYVNASFQGNIEEILLYFAEDMKEEEFELTLPVKEELFDYNLINDPNTYKPIIVDPKGEKIFQVEDDYTPIQVNSYFYALKHDEDEDYLIYRLNTASKQLEKTEFEFESYDAALGSSLLRIHKQRAYGAIDNTGNVLIPIVYDNLYKSESENVIIGNNSRSGKDNYVLYDPEGKKLASGAGRLYDFKEGIAIIAKPNESGYSYIDTKGKTVINLPGYSWVDDFSDGLAAVKKDRKVGYIDKTGKVVIPLEYTSGNPFYTGIAYVTRDGEYGLINKKNEEVVPLQNYNPVIRSGTGVDVTYVFGENEYNSYGELIESEVEE